MDKKFDQLLNEKCSWSYKSQKVINTNNAKNSEDPALQLENTIMTFQVQKQYNEEFNNTLSEKNLSVMENENWLGNLDRTDADETSITESIENISNKQHTGQQRVVEKKILKRKLNNRASENNSMQTTVPNLSATLKKKVKCTERISSSSSDNEVLQTRFSLSSDNLNKKSEDNIDDFYAIESNVEKLTYEKSRLKNDINLKRKSPIIIQAIAYNENGNTANETILIQNTTKAEKNKQMNKIESYIDSEQTISSDMLLEKLDSVSADSLSVEVNTPNTEVGSGSIEVENTNNSGLLNDKSINSSQYNTNKEMSEQIPSANINNSIIDQDVEEPDDIIQNFFNGSFDVNVYKSDEISPNKIYIKEQPNLESCAKSNQSIAKIPPTEFNNIYISEKNIFNKRKMNQPHKGQKKYKLSDTENSDKADHFTKISSQNLKMRKQDDKKIRVTKQSHPVKKRSSKNVRKRDKSVGLEDSNLKEVKMPVKKFTNTTHQVSLMSNLSCYKGDKTNLTHSVDSSSGEIEIIENESKKKNSSRKNKNKSNLNTSQKNDNFVTPRRNTRNSSLIALKRIKEIEKLENLFDNKEEIYADSEQEVDYIPPESKMQNKDQNIFELKGPSKDRKKNLKKNFTKNSIGYGKDNANDFKYGQNEEKKYSSDENASCFIIQNEIEHTGKSANTKKNKEVLSNNKLETHNVTDKYAIRRNRNKSINTEFKANLGFTNELTFEKDMQQNLNVSTELYSNRKKGQSKEFVNQKNGIFNYYNDASNKDLTNKDCTIKCKKSITQCKTWGDLENELLSEFDNETFDKERNVSKTVIVKKKQLIRKKGVTKDENLLTVSNTSMTQMISKSRSGSKYNMRYEIQNTKSKYMESILNINKFQNADSLFGAIPNSTSMCILEKAISAMEKCTAGFVTPQTNTTQIEWTNSASQHAIMSRSSDTKDETQQFDANIIYTSKENDQYTSNKKISHNGRARNKRENSKRTKNTLQISNDYNVLLQNNDKNENSDTDHLYNMSLKCNILNGDADKNKSNLVTQALEIHSGKKNNPWDDLLKNLNLEHTDYSANRIHEDEYNNARKQRQKESSKKSAINLKRYNTRSKKLHVITDFGHKAKSHDEINVENVDERKYIECESLISSHENESIFLTQGKKECNNLNMARDLNFADQATDIECEKVTNIAEIIEPTGVNREDEIQKNSKSRKIQKNSNLEQSEGKKKNIKEVSTIAKDKKCHKYKLNMKDGNLKLKIHSSESSDNSEDFAELNKPENLKNKHTKDETERERKEYNNYLKKLFEQRDGGNAINNKNVANIQTNKTANHSNFKISNKNPKAIWIRNEKENATSRIIAKDDDDDVFSISSSDSEISTKKSPGSGLLCDYFDE